MGSLEGLERCLLAGTSIVLFISGRILCGCGSAFPGLQLLQEHVEEEHGLRKDKKGQELGGLRRMFANKFVFPHEKEVKFEMEGDIKETVVTVHLPEGVTCVCLNEHDIGAFAGTSRCHLCQQDCDHLESLNKHVAETHRVSQVLIGQNILFERPHTAQTLPSAFFCPMLNCKYHIAESDQNHFFKTFKLLKQHYTKVHAVKNHPCDICGQKFGSASYLELHKKTCGQTFTCTECFAAFPALESLQTHSRRKGHALLPSQHRRRPVTAPPLRPCRTPLPLLAPRPSALHIQAAIALSELGEKGRSSLARADIGIQTDLGAAARTSSSPGRLGRRKVEVETQTRDRGGRRRCPTVSSQVQTLGEFTVRAKRRLSPGSSPPCSLASQASQCRLSPPKAARLEDKQTEAAPAHLSFSLSVDIPDLADLWPLRALTSGTQTSPRVPRAPPRYISLEEELQLQRASCRPPLLADQGRQFSTETQTEFDIFLDSIGVLAAGSLEAAAEPLETSSMETQTLQGEEEDFLLFSNNCTQTELERLFSPPAAASLSSETQTRLTGFQDQARTTNTLLHSVLTSEDMYTNIETQTCDLQDFLA